MTVDRLRGSLRCVAAGLGLVLAAGLANAYVSSTWYEDAGGYEEATRLQKAEHAPLLVYFHVDWCPYCRAFDQLLGEYEMRSKLGEALKVRINPEHGPAEKALFEQRFGAKGYPSIYWIASPGAMPRKLSQKAPAAAFLGQLN